MRCWSVRRLRSLGPRLIWWSALAAAWCAASLIGFAPQAAAATLTGATWSVSKSTTGATATSYTYTFTAATASPLNSVTMTVPSGTSGTPTVGTVSPASLMGGSVALASNTLTYTFTSASIAAGTAISIQINGLTNTSTAGSSTSTITTRNGASAVDSGTTGIAVLTAGAVGSPAWTASSLTVGATGVSYTYTFTIPALSIAITTITMTVPPGTTGTPTVGAVSPSGLLGGTVSLSGTTLTYSSITLAISLSTINVSIQINGLTNTPTAGSYTSQIVAQGLLGSLSGITNALTFTGTLNLTSPSTLSWSTTLNGTDQSVVDAVSADQQLSVSDQTGTGAGWHITVAATTFGGAHTLANVGTFVFTGSVSSVTATTAPTATCATSCIPPTSMATYPVAITTAASSPTPATVYDVSAGSGVGPIILGGHSASNPVGWWVNIPASARTGSYISTVTVAVVSGP